MIGNGQLSNGTFAPGNQLSVGRSKPITDIIKRIITQEAAGKLDAGRLRAGLDKVFDAASTGDLAALTFIRDTVQGKPAQAISIQDAPNDARSLTIAQLSAIITSKINELPAIADGQPAPIAPAESGRGEGAGVAIDGVEEPLTGG